MFRHDLPIKWILIQSRALEQNLDRQQLHSVLRLDFDVLTYLLVIHQKLLVNLKAGHVRFHDLIQFLFVDADKHDQRLRSLRYSRTDGEDEVSNFSR